MTGETQNDGRAAVMRFISTFCFLLIFYATASVAEAVQLKNVRIWAAPDSTRVVFDVTAPVQHSLELLSDPFRVAIDMKNTQLLDKLAEPAAQDKFLRRIRSGEYDNFLRIVLDLKKHSRVKSFQLAPNERYGHRLVIDIFNEREERFLPAQPEIKDEALSLSFRDVVVAIDAGHGGEDPGARGPRGTYEKKVVLQIAKKLAGLINRERGMRAVLTRQGDYYLSLRKRIALARKHKADLFISVHADAFRDSRVRGSSVYVLSGRGASSEHARWLAEQENASDLIGGVSLDDRDDLLASVLLDLSQAASLEASIDAAERVLGGLRKIGKLHKPRVESAAFAVLKSPDIPSILIETAFISNPHEEKKLLNSAHQRRIAKAIVAGLKGYFGIHAPEGTLLAARKHIIERGDTLSGIAQYYRVSLRSLRTLNDLSGDRIKVGQVLAIPAASGS